jgi:3-oxoacyl-[acyl-carrier-protein] synthase-1
MSRAKARGATIYGEIVGYYANSDGYDMVQLSGEGAVRCMKAAMAGVKQPIDYVNTHGTSTPVGDSKETAALREAFGGKVPPFSSTKSLTGHSLGAVGAQETIYSLIMMRDRFLVESAHIEELDPEFEGLPIVRQRIDNAKIDCFLTNSFGFGGTNGCLVVARAG